MLTLQLRALEDDGVVAPHRARHRAAEVEYALTDYGRTLGPIIEAMEPGASGTGAGPGAGGGLPAAAPDLRLVGDRGAH